MRASDGEYLEARLAALLERLRTHSSLESDLTAELIDSFERGAVERAGNFAQFVEGVAAVERILTEIPAVEAEQFIRFLALPDELAERFESEKPNLPSIFRSNQVEILRSLGQHFAHEADAELVPLWFDVYRELTDRRAQPDQLSQPERLPLRNGLLSTVRTRRVARRC